MVGLSVLIVLVVVVLVLILSIVVLVLGRIALQGCLHGQVQLHFFGQLATILESLQDVGVNIILHQELWVNPIVIVVIAVLLLLRLLLGYLDLDLGHWVILWLDLEPVHGCKLSIRITHAILVHLVRIRIGVHKWRRRMEHILIVYYGHIYGSRGGLVEGCIRLSHLIVILVLELIWLGIST